MAPTMSIAKSASCRAIQIVGFSWAHYAPYRGNEAVVEFQKILDLRGVVLNEPISARAHLESGRAGVMQGAVSAQKHAR